MTESQVTLAGSSVGASPAWSSMIVIDSRGRGSRGRWRGAEAADGGVVGLGDAVGEQLREYSLGLVSIADDGAGEVHERLDGIRQT